MSYKVYLKNHRRHESRIIGAAPPEIGGHFIRVGPSNVMWWVSKDGKYTQLVECQAHDWRIFVTKFLVPYVNHQLHLGERQRQ